MTRADGGGFGPDPWRQAHWDWRAAGNFMGGGAGSGLIVVAALSGARGTPLAVALLAGLALVGAGLLCVWLEIGRPWRAMNVFRNPRTSWMSREAMVAALLVPATLAAAAGAASALPVAALLALAFLYCQSRILRAARGIPAWRAPLAAPLLVATGLAEGGGLFFALGAWPAAANGAIPWLWGALVLARGLLWQAYHQALATPATARAHGALAPPGRTLLGAGTALPLGALVLATALPAALTPWLLAAGGLAAAASGAWVKHALVTRASFNQGFALARLPVRGVRP